jgi:hypothetical protein
MKKYILGIISILWISFWATLAQDIFPDSAEVTVTSPLIVWQAANLWITIYKNWAKMTNYDWTIYMEVVNEKWNYISTNDRSLPWKGSYKFLASDQWHKEFQKWLEIKKEWTFYILVYDMNDPDIDKVLGSWLVVVTKGPTPDKVSPINVLEPTEEQQVNSETIEIIAQAENLPNSKALIYIDDNQVDETTTDWDWGINHKVSNITPWKHSLKIEIPDIAWSLLGSSDLIHFSNTPEEDKWIKGISIDPPDWLMVWDSIKITVYTDEMIDTVKMKLSDRPENDDIILTKKWIWEFSQTIALLFPWEVSISLETTSTNSFVSKKYDNVEKFTVWDAPSIVNIKTNVNREDRKARVFWETTNGKASSYLVNYRFDWISLSWQERKDTNYIEFNNVPLDITWYVNVTPYRDNASKHWTSSETIRFKITKNQEDNMAICWNWVREEWETCDICPQDCWWDNWDNGESSITLQPTCTIQNISTRTQKIWNSYYLIWDKIDNVSKYIVYSSTKPDWSDKVKVYETSDTSYEYPFDYESEDDVFAYFWIVWICDDWTELKLTWATKVQVWPAENFFLLLCLTLLIYFWIKIFRQTED